MDQTSSRDELDEEQMAVDQIKWVAHCMVDFNNQINIMQFSRASGWQHTVSSELYI